MWNLAKEKDLKARVFKPREPKKTGNKTEI